MNLRSLFTSKNARIFWINIILMVIVLFSAPTIVLHIIDNYTNHGVKIEVPSLMGVREETAADQLEHLGLRYAVSDSAYNADYLPGMILDQTPKAGAEVKPGRIIYLTINRSGDKPVKFPDIIRNTSLRQAESQLIALGFKLTPVERVPGEQKDWVIGVKQGMRHIYAGMMVNRDKALTIVAGGGESDSLDVDIVEEEEFQYED